MKRRSCLPPPTPQRVGKGIGIHSKEDDFRSRWQFPPHSLFGEGSGHPTLETLKQSRGQSWSKRQQRGVCWDLQDCAALGLHSALAQSNNIATVGWALEMRCGDLLRIPELAWSLFLSWRHLRLNRCREKPPGASLTQLKAATFGKWSCHESPLQGILKPWRRDTIHTW